MQQHTICGCMLIPASVSMAFVLCLRHCAWLGFHKLRLQDTGLQRVLSPNCLLCLRCRCCWLGVVRAHQLRSKRPAGSHHSYLQGRRHTRQRHLLWQRHRQSPRSPQLPDGQPLHSATYASSCRLRWGVGMGRMQPELWGWRDDCVVHSQHASVSWVSCIRSYTIKFQPIRCKAIFAVNYS
jgi:hypothetical protein